MDSTSIMGMYLVKLGTQGWLGFNRHLGWGVEDNRTDAKEFDTKDAAETKAQWMRDEFCRKDVSVIEAEVPEANTNSQVDKKVRRKRIAKTTGKCSYCPPHGKENGSKRPRSDRHKQKRR